LPLSWLRKENNALVALDMGEWDSEVQGGIDTWFKSVIHRFQVPWEARREQIWINIDIFSRDTHFNAIQSLISAFLNALIHDPPLCFNIILYRNLREICQKGHRTEM
jgi:hypothetical protein